MPKPEIVLVAGPPGGGKSSFVKSLVAEGYNRINRDEVGGSLATNGQSYSILRMAYAAGERSFVLDNVFATVADRKVVIDEAVKLGLPIRIVWLLTSPEQAQFFAARRQVQRYGKLFNEADYKVHGKTDPNMFPPAAQFAYWKKVQEPYEAEGFTAVDTVNVEISLGSEYKNRAIILDYDGTLRVTKSGDKYPKHPNDVTVLGGRADLLKLKQTEGFLLLGASNQSGIAKTPGDPKYVSEADAIACFEATNKGLGLPIHYLYASEAAGMPKSYWRKPAPGMGVYFIETYKLNPADCIYVGDMKTDETFAQRCGFQFAWAHEFFRG